MPSDKSTSNIVEDRRRFLKLATMGSLGAALVDARAAAPVRAENAHTGNSAVSAYGVLEAMTPGAVRPNGWLELYLQKQANNLASQLPSVSWPFTQPYWDGEERTFGHEWWGWEQRAYWTDGAVRCALVLRNQELMKIVRKPIDYTLHHASPDGYLGPAYLRQPEERWPQHVFFRALAAYSDATQDTQIVEAVRRHYLADRNRNPSFYERSDRGSVSNIENMLWVYEKTRDPQLLRMAQGVWEHFQSNMLLADRESWDLHPQRVFAGTRIRAHGISYAEVAKLPAILYMHTGNPEYLRFAVAAQERMFTHHMLIDGLPSCAEEFMGTGPLDTHETCNISDMTWGWGFLLMATGEGVWADRIERACFNAGFGLIKKDWTGVQYFSGPNQVIATDDSSHVAYGFGTFSKGWMAFRPNPGHETACCGGNVHRFLPNYVIRMWMRDKEGGIAAVLYGPSVLQAVVGPDHERIEIIQETHYPFDEQIQLTVRSNRPVTFPLSLRIPQWCDSPQLAVNGAPIVMPRVQHGFVKLDRTFQPGDRIVLVLPMRTSISFWPGSWAELGVGLEHGPLVYALKVHENWTPSVVPDYSTARFPDWNAKPASQWNYGVVSPDMTIVQRTRFKRAAMTQDPWVDPPVTLTVEVKEIPNWTLQTDPQSLGRLMTPPHPLAHDSAGEIQNLPLVPYGATHLRVSVFSQV